MSSSEIFSSQKVVGYWMSEKKRQKLNFSEFDSVCRLHGYELKKLDLKRPIEEQGNFNIILHKLTDIIAQADNGEHSAQEMINRLETYLIKHPEIPVIDPLSNVRQLLNRYKSYTIINESNLENIADSFTPTFVELTSSDVQENLNKLKSAGVHFPFVCKHATAHGSTDAHMMAVIFNEAGVADCRPPCVAQSFICHDAILFKLFIVGNEYTYVERPSLKNFTDGQDKSTIYFNSHDVSKADSTSSLSILDPDDEFTILRVPEKGRFDKIVNVLRNAFGMKLLGLDVVLEKGSNRYAIIDVNAYPGYDGYPNFFESLMKCIEWSIEEKKIEKACKNVINDQDDSGIDTGYSSDEKKKNKIQIHHKKVTDI